MFVQPVGGVQFSNETQAFQRPKAWTKTSTIPQNLRLLLVEIFIDMTLSTKQLRLRHDFGRFAAVR